MNPLELVGKVDGIKTYLLATVLIAVGGAEMMGLDIIEAVDGSNAWDTLIIGVGLLTGRSALKKLEIEK